MAIKKVTPLLPTRKILSFQEFIQEQTNAGFTPIDPNYDSNKAYFNYLQAIEQPGPHPIPKDSWVQENI